MASSIGIKSAIGSGFLNSPVNLFAGISLLFIEDVYRRDTTEEHSPRFRLVLPYIRVLLFQGEIRHDIHRIIASQAVIVSSAYSYRLSVQVVEYFRDFEGLRNSSRNNILPPL